MKITPKKEEELSKFANLPAGQYPFTVLESDEVASKSAKNAGKMMFKLKLNVHGPDFDKHVYDYFADWFSEWKLKHFCDTTGMAEKYESGNLDGRRNAFEGRQGFVLLEVESSAQFGEKNIVSDYQVPEKKEKKAKKEAVPAAEEENDDVPF